jgi:hypothetical protein
MRRPSIHSLTSMLLVAVAVAVLHLAFAHGASESSGLLFATVTASGAVASVHELKKQRDKALRDALSHRSEDGTFADDRAREQFDSGMKEFDRLDAQVRELEQMPAPAAASPAPEEIRRQAIEGERRRASEIRDAVRLAGLESSVADDMVTRGLAIDAARAEVFQRLASASDRLNPQSSHVSLGEDARDKTLRGQVNWLLVRSGFAGLVAKHEGLKDNEIEPGEFRGMTLLDLAKEYLTRANISFRGKDRMDIAGLAFRGNYQTTSDFAVLLENTMHKILRAAYALQADTWSRWCGTASVSDFRAHNWYRMGCELLSRDSRQHHRGHAADDRQRRPECDDQADGPAGSRRQGDD